MTENTPSEQPKEETAPVEEKKPETTEEKKPEDVTLTADLPVDDKVTEPEIDVPEEPKDDKVTEPEIDVPEEPKDDLVEEPEVVEEEDEVEPEPVWLPPKKKIFTMRDIIIGKLIINITTGASGEPLEKAKTVLRNMVEQQPCERRAKQTIRTWSIRKGEPISCLVTLRGTKAEDFLKRGFTAVRNRISPRSFDRDGNFAFGIKEHIDIPGERYNPNLGIIGMDVIVNLERPGYRVKRKRRARSRIGHTHRVTRDEAMEFVKSKYGVEVELPVER